MEEKIGELSHKAVFQWRLSAKTHNHHTQDKQMIIVYTSLVVNILVAGFWGVVLAFMPKANFRVWPYGSDSPSSRILSSLYLTIALLSVYALLDSERMIPLCIFLFIFQILYKCLSVMTVRDIKNPVVLANLAIVVLHSFSLNWLLFHSRPSL